MTTAHQVFPRQSSHPTTASTSPRARDLPEAGERRRLREQWGLSTRQVAAAFGVTPATVRSWESGRSAPRGGRKEAYRRFLAGLAQHGGHNGHGGPSGTGAPSPARGPVRLAAGDPERGAHPPTPGPARARQRAAGAGVLRVRNVSGRRADPVSAGRVRRLRLLWAAACVWSLAWWVVLTCPVPV
ncbi:helix-turn-helix domain-containing protein [Streptomyces sp. NPDC012421]|uniref:helix-turn-helix domain-containing protein n=1 Tax=Streptomyces sp. NPDC012421 TaxID=3364832 RepID=UPI0036DFCF08